QRDGQGDLCDDSPIQHAGTVAGERAGRARARPEAADVRPRRYSEVGAWNMPDERPPQETYPPPRNRRASGRRRPQHGGTLALSIALSAAVSEVSDADRPARPTASPPLPIRGQAPRRSRS